VRIVLIEDEPYWRDYVTDAVRRNPAYEVVAACGSLVDAQRLIRETAFDLLIVDLGLPDGSGLEAIRTARRLYPDVNILVATVFDDEKSVLSAVCAGATGYILKESPFEEWCAAIESTIAGHSVINPRIARYILHSLQQPNRSRRLMASLEESSPAEGAQGAHPEGSTDALTPRELEVLRLVSKGFTLPEVGQILHLSIATIRTHTRHVYAKLEVHTRGEAISEATRLGIV
jgi:DNA-binding NarL/FixJ family response regulator